MNKYLDDFMKTFPYEVWVNNVAVNPLAYMLPGDYAVD